MNENIQVWLDNARTFHYRVVARFLRNRGWVVFYLPEDQRECNHDRDICWLKLSQSSP